MRTPGAYVKQVVTQVHESAPESRSRTGDEINQRNAQTALRRRAKLQPILMRISIFVSSSTTSYRFRCSSRRGMISTKLHGRCL